MDYAMYKFPTQEDGVQLVEQKLCELMSKYRNHENLDPIELDYMDWANSVMLTSESKY